MPVRTLIRVEQVNKIYRRHQADEFKALDDVSFCIAAGEAVAVTGPSGSGKSTLLSLIGCMARPTSGSIAFRERRVGKLPEHFLARIRRESFGFVFQQYHLLPDYSVLENILLPLYPTDIPWREMKTKAQGPVGAFLPAPAAT